MCLNPQWVVNPRYRRSAFNPEVTAAHEDWFNWDYENLGPDYMMFKVQVPCGRCRECLKRRASDWRTRLLMELRYGKKCIPGRSKHLFVTLTFNNESLQKFGTDAVRFNRTQVARPLRLFFERYRKRYGKSLRHWLVVEKCPTTGRVHFHGIFFNCRAQTHDILSALWSYGYIWIGWVSPRTCNYCLKYVTKIDENFPDYIPFVFASPGIGKDFLHSSASTALWTGPSDVCDGFLSYIEIGCGYRVSLPRYYKYHLAPREYWQGWYWMRHYALPPWFRGDLYEPGSFDRVVSDTELLKYLKVGKIQCYTMRQAYELRQRLYAESLRLHASKSRKQKEDMSYGFPS